MAACTLLAWPAVLVVVGGLAFTAAYSLRPVRISERGVLAPMLLPLAYVAVPYLLGIFAVRWWILGSGLAYGTGGEAPLPRFPTRSPRPSA